MVVDVVDSKESTDHLVSQRSSSSHEGWLSCSRPKESRGPWTRGLAEAGHEWRLHVVSCRVYDERMDSTQLAQVLADLRNAEQEKRERVDVLQRELHTAQGELDRTNKAVQALEGLLGESTQARTGEGASGDGTEVNAEEQPEVINSAGTEAAAEPVKPEGKTRRVNSTQIVVDIVDRAGEPISREVLRNRLLEEVGAGVWSNPQNAANTAILRAANNERIQVLDGDQFAPKNWRPTTPSVANDPY